MLKCILIQDTAALAFDAANVISQAVKRQSCSHMNGCATTVNDADAMLNC